MAKASAKKKSSATPAKKVGKKRSVTAVASKSQPAMSIESACRSILSKLKELNLDWQLQAEIEWCLGSYKTDQNPVGLFQMCNRAIEIFKRERTRKTKGITSKLISDLEKAANA